MPRPSQEPAASSKVPNQDLKEMDVLCAKRKNMDVLKTSMYPNEDPNLNPSHEPPASSKAPNQDLKDTDVLYTFKIKIESQNAEYG